MKKPKIAISLDKGLLDAVDSKVDGEVIRSRSQAVEYYLRKGLAESLITTAVILLKGDHQKYALQQIGGESLVRKQIEMLVNNGITRVFVVTNPAAKINELMNELRGFEIDVRPVQVDVGGNAPALESVKDSLENDFVVMSGDIYNDFNLTEMIKKHNEAGKLSTMGLITREKATKFGNAVLSGDLIVEFEERPSKVRSHAVNAGIYIFKPEVLELIGEGMSLEKDLFPKLAKIKQVVGFFTLGKYIHLEE